MIYAFTLRGKSTCFQPGNMFNKRVISQTDGSLREHSFSHTVRSSHNSPFSPLTPHSASSLPSTSGPTRRGNRKAFVFRLTTNDSMQGNVIASRKQVSACIEASFQKQTHIIERNGPQTLCICPLRFVWAKTYPDLHDPFFIER